VLGLAGGNPVSLGFTQNLQSGVYAGNAPELAGHKWFLAKPRSGLNDVFCQLEKSIVFAEKHGRWVAVEATNSGLLLPISDVFEGILSRVPIFALEKEPRILKILDSLSCFPPEIEGAVSSYHSALYNPRINTGERPVLARKFSWREKSRHSRAQVIVHESGGGGFASARFLTRVTLKDAFRQPISRRLSDLPSNYLGVHIRHTDVTSDWRRVLEEVGRRRGNLPVFLATDSAKVQEAALTHFGPGNVLIGSRRSNRDGEQLHENYSEKSLSQRMVTLEDALFDLMALAYSSELVFGGLRQSQAVSGFSRLARFLFHHPEVTSQIVGFTPDKSRWNNGERKSVQIGAPLDIWRENIKVFFAERISPSSRGLVSGKP